MSANTLLADPISMRNEKFDALSDSILIVIKTIQPTASCPKCGKPSDSLKSRCLRPLADLAVA